MVKLLLLRATSTNLALTVLQTAAVVLLMPSKSSTVNNKARTARSNPGRPNAVLASFRAGMMANATMLKNRWHNESGKIVTK